MCFASGEDPNANHLDTKETHLLDVMNAGTWSEHSFDYVRKAVLQVDTELTGPESTYLLRDLFNYRFYPAARDKERPNEERIYGTVMFREADSTVNYSFFKLILRDYVNCNIKKILNMDIKEYLALTPYEKMIYDEFAIECSQVIADEVSKMEKDNDRNIKKATMNLEEELDDFT